MIDDDTIEIEVIPPSPEPAMSPAGLAMASARAAMEAAALTMGTAQAATSGLLHRAPTALRMPKEVELSEQDHAALTEVYAKSMARMARRESEMTDAFQAWAIDEIAAAESALQEIRRQMAAPRRGGTKEATEE